jgi:FkbM family methyltransferase
MVGGLAKDILNIGGSIYPLLISSEETKGTSTINPSVFNDNGKLIVNLRHIQYTLWHTRSIYENRYGPLVYINPENDITLKTVNYLGEWPDGNFRRVDTSDFDTKPMWEFIGLEDARVVRWDGKLYLSGVRRDVKPDGEGRIELSEIIDSKEVSRTRIQPPSLTYCEKNWMPINDMPFHYVKWCNPTEIVRVDGDKSTTVFTGTPFYIEHDLRGGGNVITIGDNRMAIVHQSILWKNRQGKKEANYYHLFLIWDKEWNILKISEPFNFLTGTIEFSCGLASLDNKIIVTFGFEDDAAYLIEIPTDWLMDWIYGSRAIDIKRKPFLNYGDISDEFKLHSYKEIFVEHIYEKFADIKKGDVVLDIGANIGAFAYSIYDNEPSVIYCVEPSAEIVRIMKDNLKGKRNINIIQKAIWYNNDENTDIKSNKLDIYSHVGDTIPAITFKQLISECGITHVDFMKIDCEGGEYAIFSEENYEWISRNVSHIAGEWHLGRFLTEFKRFRDIYLTGNEYRVIEGYHINYQNEISDKMHDDIFLDEYVNAHGINAQLLIYINYE